MMQQTPPPPVPSVAGPVHQAQTAPFLAAFTQAGLRAVDAGHIPALHPAFLHPLYHHLQAAASASAPGLASLRAAAAGAAAAAAGYLQGSPTSSGTSSSLHDRNKSFTIDAILGKEAEKLGIDGSDPDSTEKVLGEYFHNNNNKDNESHSLKDSNLAVPVGYGFGGMRTGRDGVFNHPHLHPHHVTHPLHRAVNHPRLGGPPVTHPYLSQLTCNPGLSYRHHQSQFSRDKSDKKHSVSSEWKAGKAKRVRTIFTPEQLERLEAEFERQQYMVGTERYYLAASLNLTEAQVKVWFQNRRIKWRKQNLEQQHAKLAKLDMLAKHGDVESESSESEAEQERHEVVDDVVEKCASVENVVTSPEAEDQRLDDFESLERDR